LVWWLNKGDEKNVKTLGKHLYLEMDSLQEQMQSASKEGVVSEVCMSEHEPSICALTG